MKKRKNLTRIKKLSMLFSLMLFAAFHAKAQSEPRDAYITMEVSPTNPTLLEGTFIVTLSDTTDINNIEVRIGTTSGGTEIFSHVFAFDVQTGLPGGLSYLRNSYIVTLGIGTFTDKSTFYGEVRVQGNNSTWSNGLKFITN